MHDGEEITGDRHSLCTDMIDISCNGYTPKWQLSSPMQANLPKSFDRHILTGGRESEETRVERHGTMVKRSGISHLP